MSTRSRRNTKSLYPARDLSYIVALGGRTRRHKYLREMMTFSWPVVTAILLQAFIYFLVMMRSGRTDWYNMVLAIGTMACVPVMSAVTLTAFRRHDAPIVAASVVATGFFSVAVSVLSALRIPISYQALAWCLPISVIGMAYANIRFHRTLDGLTAMAPFAHADNLTREIGAPTILSGPDADIDGIEVLLIDPREHHGEKWSALLARCYLGGIEVMPWTRYLEMRRGRVDVESFDISHVVYSPSQLLYARTKRSLDLLALLVTVPLTVPLAALVALYIRLVDGGPVLFVQIRRGYGGRRFRMYKFRTMYKGAGGGSTAVRDTRILPGCRILRKLRIDEIPQLFNVLRGDMSLIGPRPVAEYVARAITKEEPKYALRSLVLPGLTGWAQVMYGYAGTTSEELEKLSHDLYYIKHLSFDLDLLVLFKSVRTVLLGFGAR